MNEGKKVLVGMSGGVDSSAVCMLLQEQGYDVHGLTLRMWDIPSQFSSPGQTEPNHIIEARALAGRLGIPHYTLDVREEFSNTVIRNFIGEYMNARTPNPCVMCNLHLKWNYLMSEAARLGCDYVATGHYATVGEDENGVLYVVKGDDEKKDQSYFLWRLGQSELSRTLFPLGKLKKEAIKEYVLRKGFREKAEKKESMEICFVESDYRDFLHRYSDVDEQVKEGLYIDELGRPIGKHKGYPFYTIGQRKGLDIALGYPAFVVKINPEKNTIRLGKREELLADSMLVEDLNTQNLKALEDNEELEVRIRYRSPGVRARIKQVEDNLYKVDFAEPVSAVTPGQSAVFYYGDRVVGGAFIADQKRLKKFK